MISALSKDQIGMCIIMRIPFIIIRIQKGNMTVQMKGSGELMQISMGMAFFSQKKIEKDEFERVMADHKLWLEDNTKGKRADLSEIDLSEQDLSGMDFSHANMMGINLRGSNLSDANLSYADLSKAYLHNVDLTNATINGACFFNANLTKITMDGCKGEDARFHFACMWDGKYRNAILKKAVFFNAEICDCDFTGADLEEASFPLSDMDNTIFRNANLRNASLSYTYRTHWCDFSNSDMSGTRVVGVDFDEKMLKGVKGLYIPIYCPEEGAFIAWKKCREGKVVKLLIPEHAERKGSSLHTCRASEAVVLEIYDKDGNPVDEACSIQDEEFKYIKGETVIANDPPDNCGDVKGIHFVLSRAETECYGEDDENEDEMEDEE